MNRLLVASDLSRRAPNVMAKALRLADAAGSIRVVYAAPPELSDHECHEVGKQLLIDVELLAEALDAGDLDLTARVVRGAPVQTLAGEATAFDADLIMLGGHGEIRLRDALLGTTASELLRTVDRPILVVRNDHALPYAKVMVALDDSDADETALGLSARIAPQAELVAIHTFERQDGEFASDEELAARVQRREQDRLDEIKSSLGVTNTVRCIVRQGDSNDALMRGWTELAPDLVAIATHRPSAFRRLFAGSHADAALLGCPVDMLVMQDGIAKSSRVRSRENESA